MTQEEYEAFAQIYGYDIMEWPRLPYARRSAGRSPAQAMGTGTAGMSRSGSSRSWQFPSDMAKSAADGEWGELVCQGAVVLDVHQP
jgi:hypothetical protein